MTYFNNLPKITITNPIDNSEIDIVDLFRTIKFDNNIRLQQNLYQKYYIKNGERPEQISFNYYSDTKYYWVILLINKINNDNWVMSDYELETFLQSLANQNDIKYYITKELKDSSERIIIPYGLIVDFNFEITIENTLYNNFNAIIPVTYRDYIIQKNEKKRTIILLDPIIVSKLDDDFIKLIKYETRNLTERGTKFEEI